MVDGEKCNNCSRGREDGVVIEPCSKCGGKYCNRCIDAHIVFERGGDPRILRKASGVLRMARMAK